MNDKYIRQELLKFSSGCLCNASPEIKAMRGQLIPLLAGVKLIGPARTAKISPGQNAAIHRAVAHAKPREVLVVDGGGSESFGPFGDILATTCQQRQIAGLVINSTIRDRAEIKKLGFPVFSLGGNPGSTSKKDPGKINAKIKCAGVPVSPGDYIVGDDDGVVVVPHALVSKTISLAKKVLEKEKIIFQKLKAGKNTCEIFDIPL